MEIVVSVSGMESGDLRAAKLLEVKSRMRRGTQEVGSGLLGAGSRCRAFIPRVRFLGVG